jgi:hypothetical protein
MRRILGWVVGVLLIVVIVVFGLQVIASETGEVVVLHTTADGEQVTTRLWVVDLDGDPWLRAGSASGWYARLVASPEVLLARQGMTARYVAEPRTERRAEVNALMADKYGWRDRLIEVLVGGRDDAIPVRLRPAD